MKTVVVMFAKAPVPGDVKTRLGKTIGFDWSASFHQAFVADLSETISQTGFDCVLCFAGDPKHEGFDPCRAKNFEFIAQPDGDLGARLTEISLKMFKKYERIIIIGSDSPTLGTHHFLRTNALLDDNDVVLGPSFDGGYYLIGLNRSAFLDENLLHVFQGIDWSSEQVLAQTLDSCVREHQRCELLGFWYDVDTVIDLNFLRTHLQHLTIQDEKMCNATKVRLEEFDQTAK